MMRKLNSLTFRFFISMAIWSLAILFIASLLLFTSFQSGMERNFDLRLQATLDWLSGNIEINQNGNLVVDNNIAAQVNDSRYSLPASGWYWQISSLEKDGRTIIKSNSLLNEVIEVNNELYRKKIRLYTTDNHNNNIRKIEEVVKFNINSNTKYKFHKDKEISFVVTGNSSELEREINDFLFLLLKTMGAIAIGLIITGFVMIGFVLQPMKRLKSDLVSIKSGLKKRLDSDFPQEINPVVNELNSLLQANEIIISKARYQVGNLAHGLKTPITVIKNEIINFSNNDSTSIIVDNIEKQIRIMQEQVSHYLQRARKVAKAHNSSAKTNVLDVITAVTRTLNKINSHKNIDVSINIDKRLFFRGEKSDLEEIIGNIMDNAFKWTQSKISIRAFLNRQANSSIDKWLEIIISDNGLGLPKNKISTVMERGQRLDENKPGSGLGLSIVVDTIEMYNGSFCLSSPESKGLEARIILPASI